MFSRSRFRSIAAVFAALAAAAVMTTTAAGVTAARPGDLIRPGNIYTQVSVTGNVSTGCAATVNATVQGNSGLGLGAYLPGIRFWDNNTYLGEVTPTRQNAGPGRGPALQASIQWTPQVAGTHVIRARYLGGNYTRPSDGYTTVRVGQGMNLGSACLPM